tara:strand:- start:6005 stop:6748 length:744 start_codon:yes stop_codon:yes gene_type:complete
MRISDYGMFAPLPLSILKRTDLSGNGKLVYARLLLFAGENGQAFPSRDTLSKEVGISIASVKRAIAELANLNLLTRKQRGHNRSNIYALTPTPLVGQICTTGRVKSAPLDGSNSHPLIEATNKTKEKKYVIKRETPTKGQRIKKDWRPGEGCIAWCLERTTDEHIEAAIETFIDYWLSASGRPSIKRDWDAAFRNWIRNDIKWDRHKPKSSGSVHASSTSNTKRRRAGLAAAFEQRVESKRGSGTVH